MKQKVFLLILLVAAPMLFFGMAGDVNGDNKVDIADALAISKHTAAIPLVNFNTLAADVDGDLKVTIVDALNVARYYVGTLDTLIINMASGGGACQETELNFNNNNIKVKKINGRWTIADGNKIILDFQESKREKQKDAEFALKIMKQYNMNSKRYVGSEDQPALMYFLSNGSPTQGPFPGERSIRFNPDNLEISEQFGGTYSLVDGHEIITSTFGETLENCENALCLIKKYGFNHICFFGKKNSALSYFRKDGKSGGGLACSATKETFNNDNVSVKRVNGAWSVVDGSKTLITFTQSQRYAQADAEKALKIIKHYEMNSLHTAGADMMFLLVDGSSPSGSFSGESSISFNPDKLKVWETRDGSFKIVEGRKTILEMNGTRSEADNALCLIKQYGFKNICFVGRPDPSMIYFRK